MKSLNQIQQDLEAEGFKCIGGGEEGKRYKMREFERLEKGKAFSTICVYSFHQDDNGEPDLEQGISVKDLDIWERTYLLNALFSKYSFEIVKLIADEALEIPLWLQKEILERRREK